MLKPTSRRTGTIRQKPLAPVPLPPSYLDLTINNISIQGEMKGLATEADHIYERYEQIIRDLERMVADLEERNCFINEERLRLQGENCKLRQELESYQDNYMIPHSRVKQVCLFDVVPDEDSIPAVFPKPSKPPNKTASILQQSEFDIGPLPHHFTQQISAELSLSQAEAHSQERTPCLNNHHTLIQCKSNNNQAPLRVFYLLLLQEQEFIRKLKEQLAICVQDENKVLLHLLPTGNELWAKILEQFLDSIVKGEFQNEKQVVEYIAQNPLIDMLLISLLKLRLPVQNDNEDLNIGDWKNQYIDHRALFQGLSNEFDFRFEDDRENGVLKFYANGNQDIQNLTQSKSQEVSQQNLLESRTQTDKKQQVAQISLFCRQNNPYLTSSESRQEPKFKIWLDRQRLHFRINISIRPQRYQQTQDQYGHTQSFHQTEQQQQQEQSAQQSEQQIQAQQRSLSEQDRNLRPHHKKYNENYLMQKDLNRQWSYRPKYSTQQYLRPVSKHISADNSYGCSLINYDYEGQNEN